MLKKVSDAIFSTIICLEKQGWRQESSDKGADASDGGADYFGTRILKADGSSETSIERCQHYWHCVAVQ